MRYSEPPSADIPVLIFLSSAVAGLFCFGWIMHSMMQPTVLTNAALAGIEAHQRSPVLLSALQPHGEETEGLAFALARRENAEQGLKPLAALEPLSRSDNAASPPKPAKAKRVRAQTRQLDRVDPRNSWAFAPPHRGVMQRSPRGPGFWFW
jgi:hypothetical protein